VFWSTLALAVGLLCILEGITPFIAPDKWKEMVRKVGELSDTQLRSMGLGAMIVGVIIVLLVA
jgi:uncharacterized protein